MLYGYTGQCRRCGKEIPDEEELCAACRRNTLMDRLILCPYCGRSDMNEVLHTEHDDAGNWFVLCDESRGGCGAQGGKADTEEQAVSRWNDRYDLEED